MVPRTPRPRIRRREFSLLYLLWALLLCALPVSLNLLITNWPKNLRQGRNKGDGPDGASSLELRRSHDQIQMTERDAMLSPADTVLTAGNVVHVGVIQTRLSEDTRDVQTSDNVVVLSQASMIVDRLAGLASSTTCTCASTRRSAKRASRSRSPSRTSTSEPPRASRSSRPPRDGVPRTGPRAARGRASRADRSRSGRGGSHRDERPATRRSRPPRAGRVRRRLWALPRPTCASASAPGSPLPS